MGRTMATANTGAARAAAHTNRRLHWASSARATSVASPLSLSLTTAAPKPADSMAAMTSRAPAASGSYVTRARPARASTSARSTPGVRDRAASTPAAQAAQVMPVTRRVRVSTPAARAGGPRATMPASNPAPRTAASRASSVTVMSTRPTSAASSWAEAEADATPGTAANARSTAPLHEAHVMPPTLSRTLSTMRAAGCMPVRVAVNPAPSTAATRSAADVTAASNVASAASDTRATAAVCTPGTDLAGKKTVCWRGGKARGTWPARARCGGVRGVAYEAARPLILAAARPHHPLEGGLHSGRARGTVHATHIKLGWESWESRGRARTARTVGARAHARRRTPPLPARTVALTTPLVGSALPDASRRSSSPPASSSSGADARVRTCGRPGIAAWLAAGRGGGVVWRQELRSKRPAPPRRGGPCRSGRPKRSDAGRGVAQTAPTSKTGPAREPGHASPAPHPRPTRVPPRGYPPAHSRAARASQPLAVLWRRVRRFGST